MGGTSDLREPCPHVKPLIQHHTRHPAPHKTYGHHAGTNVNLAGAVVPQLDHGPRFATAGGFAEPQLRFVSILFKKDIPEHGR